MNTQDHPESERNVPPLEDARRATDERLLRERERADRVLEEELEDGERTTDRDLAPTHHRMVRHVAAAREKAMQEARAAPPGQGKLDLAVERQKRALAAQAGEAAAARAAEEALDQTKAIAEEAVAEGMARAREAMARLAAGADEALQAELHRFEELTEKERDERKRDFQELLASERDKTDRALHAERGSSDHQLRSRDEMLGTISHDLRNYLTVVGMKADLLRKAAAGVPGLRERVEDIGQACKTMARWANDLVDLSSLETGGVRLEMRVHDVSELVKRSGQAFAPMAARKNIALSLRLPRDPTPVLCDADRFAQVLHNLLDNALKFMGKPGEVVVQAEARAPGFITISVRDTGPGIPEEERPKIFQRAWHAKKGGAGGSGLGLFIGRKMVEAMGGRIRVESEVGRGSTFSFTVPRAPDGMAGEPAA